MAQQRIGLPPGKLLLSPQHWLAHLSKWCSRLRDVKFDGRYGLDTYRSFDELDKSGLPPELRASALPYVPTSTGMFGRIVRHARIEPGNFELVDLGSGKGRVLLLASRLGFRSVTGVEADPRLHRIAESNIEKWMSLESTVRPVVFEADAREAPLPSGHLFVFTFNSFGGAVFDRVAERLAVTARDEGRAVILAYHNDVCGHALDRTGAFRRVPVRPIRFWSRPTMSLFYNETAWRMRLPRRGIW